MVSYVCRFSKVMMTSPLVRWQQTVPHTISHVISHPEDDTFIVMYDRTQSASTALRKFNVTSAAFISSRTLPFKLRKVVWYPYMASGHDYTLVGITEKWTSVILGDRVNLPQDEGSLAREISSDTTPSRRNLFQDIFGVSAFQNSPSQDVVTISAIRDDANTGLLKFSRPLDTPAYLLPPLHTMFKPLVESLLQRRDARPPSEAKDENEQVEEEDAIMEDVPLSSTSASRILPNEEMYEFVELFKQQMFGKFPPVRPTRYLFTFLSASAPNRTNVPKSTSNLNGNGIAKAMNGDHHKSSSTPTAVNGRNHAPKRPAEQGGDAQESSPTIVGKKRKKSIG